MESTASPVGGAAVPDLSDLADVVAAPGPFLTVVLDTTSNIQNAEQRSEAAWKTLRRDLAERGAPEGVLSHVDSVVAEAHLEGDVTGIIANADGVLYVESWFDPPPVSWGEWGALPRLVPFIAWRQEKIPYVVVLTNREGADIEAYVPDGEDVDLHVEGNTFPIRKVKPGGWSQRRYQARAEENWNKNAKQVADEVTRVVDEIDAPVVIVAGDVRAEQLLREALPDRITERVKHVEGGRTADSGADSLSVDVRRMVKTAAAETTVALLRKFREERGQLDRYADGARDTMRALREAKVETLLVHEGTDDPRRAYFGPQPEHAALDASELKELGVDQPSEAHLVDVLVRAAIGTGAQVRVVPHTSSRGPSDDVGAILRWH